MVGLRSPLMTAVIRQADADFVDVPVEALLKKEYARTRVEETMSPTVPAQPPVK